MNEKQYERWRRIRVKGQGRYIILDGILKMGVPFALLTMLLTHLLYYGLTWPPPLRTFTGLVIEFAFKAIFFGVFVALWSWISNEKKYAEYEGRIKTSIAE